MKLGASACARHIASAQRWAQITIFRSKIKNIDCDLDHLREVWKYLDRDPDKFFGDQITKTGKQLRSDRDLDQLE